MRTFSVYLNEESSCALYRIVAQYLCLFVAECKGQILWRFFRVSFVCLTLILVIFRSIFIRDVMMSVFIFNMMHDAVFESNLFHRRFFESFQTLFESQYVHWSRILIELALFAAIFVYVSFISLIFGSFANGMSVTFGSYLMVHSALCDDTPSFIHRNSQNEVMQIGAWICCVCLTLFVQKSHN